MPAKLPTSGNTISGSLTPLSPLPNPAHQRLFNAENSTVSTDGRVFITGSTAVYEVLSAEEAGREDHRYLSCEYREISIPSDVPKDCFRNGITAFGHYLYLACPHVPQWKQLSGFPEYGSPLNEISQTKFSGLLWLMYTQTVAHVDSYIVRADLRNQDVQFDQYFKIPEKCLANGIAADKYGHLYVANGVQPGSCIYKIVWSEGHSPACDAWYSTPIAHQLNGVKYKSENVYYTWNQFFPLGLPGVGRIEVHEMQDEKVEGEQKPRPTRGQEPQALSAKTIYQTMGFFDDLDVLDNDWICLANASDYLNLSAIMHLEIPPHGSLIFICNDDEPPRVFKDTKLSHPSSVKLVDCNSKVFAKGDMIVTDKGEHGEYAAFVFRPADACQWWCK